jgi:hypothetical protein
LQDDGVDDRSDVAREIREADPVYAVAGTAVVDYRAPLNETGGRSFDGRARF